MWADAGNATLGHWVAELNPFQWSLWADAEDTIKNLETYKKRGDQHRPVQMETGPPPTKTLHFRNIGQAVEHLKSYVAPGNGQVINDSEPTTTPYPPGVFAELGGKVEVGAVKMAAQSGSARIRWGDVAELLSLALVGFVLLGVLVATLRRKRSVPERVLDEEAQSSEVLLWVEQGNLSASESDLEHQFLRSPLRTEEELE
jgi:hypothetical protein